MGKIGIFGGTFNPIHNGHLVLAQEVGHSLGFSKVLFIPSKIPPHKVQTVSEEDRYKMVCLATAENSFFEVSRIELERAEVSYTIETIHRLKQLYKEELIFIIGADNIVQLPKWYKFQQLLELCSFAIGSRPGFCISSLDILIPYIGEEHCNQIKKNCVEIPNFFISSSEIRTRYKRGYSTKYLVPDSVHHYIQEKNLYVR